MELPKSHNFFTVTSFKNSFSFCVPPTCYLVSSSFKVIKPNYRVVFSRPGFHFFLLITDFCICGAGLPDNSPLSGGGAGVSGEWWLWFLSSQGGHPGTTDPFLRDSCKGPERCQVSEHPGFLSFHELSSTLTSDHLRKDF